MTLPDTPPANTSMPPSSSTSTSTTDSHGGRSFRDAYSVLQQRAQTLRDQDEPNIDDLLTIVTESVQAYQVCKARIDAVEAALKASLEGSRAGAPAPAVQPPAPNAGASTRRPAGSAPPGSVPPCSTPATGLDDMDDDTPI